MRKAGASQAESAEVGEEARAGEEPVREADEEGNGQVRERVHKPIHLPILPLPSSQAPRPARPVPSKPEEESASRDAGRPGPTRSPAPMLRGEGESGRTEPVAEPEPAVDPETAVEPVGSGGDSVTTGVEGERGAVAEVRESGVGAASDPGEIFEGLAPAEKSPGRVEGAAARTGGAAEEREPRESGERPSVLVVHERASTYRLVRETLENFTNARTDTTSDPLHAFEMALRRDYALYIFPMHLGGMEGLFLYELLCKVCAFGHGRRRVAPSVIFLREEDDPPPPSELKQDARIRDLIVKPVRIERLLRAVDGVLERRDPV